jgi:hypothetical protein
MTTFLIDNDNNITAFVELPADANKADSFASEKDLAKLTKDWPASRLADTWNAFAGVVPFDDLKPIKKFTDRKSAIARIWKAVQRLAPDAAPQAATGTPKKVPAKKSATKGRKRHTAQTGVKTAQSGANTARRDSKKAKVVEMLRRAKGATLGEIMKSTGWQAHTVRGFVSGMLTKRMGLTVESFRTDDKERAYRITA